MCLIEGLINLSSDLKLICLMVAQYHEENRSKVRNVVLDYSKKVAGEPSPVHIAAGQY